MVIPPVFIPVFIRQARMIEALEGRMAPQSLINSYQSQASFAPDQAAAPPPCRHATRGITPKPMALLNVYISCMQVW
ncbi:hypothetical protein [Acidovorax sp. SUPP2539]|uniref:hypothetical protein n=1 Tax=Acidovorax sp. SUPP2539 TaxID=2920878 RepID=UPI0023DE50E6|nr:hypothetical protein [Acidovorax sp. SUPP2539]GKS90241.1 hypothetical protein AVTE2539_12770 [Acidovorax sp. SUPP2539]